MQKQQEEATLRIVLLALLGLTGSAYAQMPSSQIEALDGAKLFRTQCGTCHSVVADEVRQGPNLAGVYGRKAGSLEGFKYSPGFAEANWTWDEGHLDPYLTNPQAVIHGGVMGYRQSKPEIRQAIITYLKDLH